jgi:hypothetical protein
MGYRLDVYPSMRSSEGSANVPSSLNNFKWSHAQHAPNSACQMGRIRKTGPLCVRYGAGSTHQFPTRLLQTKPKNVGPQRNAHCLSKDVHKTRR